MKAAFEDFIPLEGFPYDEEEEALSQCLLKIQHSISKAVQDAQREMKFMKAQSEKKFMLSRIEDKKAQRKVARLHKRLARQAAAVKHDNAMRQNRERQIAGHKEERPLLCKQDTTQVDQCAAPRNTQEQPSTFTAMVLESGSLQLSRQICMAACAIVFFLALGWMWPAPLHQWVGCCQSLLLWVFTCVHSVTLCPWLLCLCAVCAITKAAKGAGASSSSVCSALLILVAIGAVDAMVVPHHACSAVVEDLPEYECILSFEEAGHKQICSEMAKQQDTVCNINHSTKLCKIASKDHQQKCRNSHTGFQYIQGHGAQLQESFDAQCFTAEVGSTSQGPMVVTLPTFVCPSIVNNTNWLGGYTYGDWFQVEQSGQQLTVTRKDHGNGASGWGMDLKFMCCQQSTCITAEVGTTSQGPKVVTLPTIVCPRIVNNTNWLGGYPYSDWFEALPASGSNVFETNAGTGGWGGACTCPNGQVYQVGDNGDSCGSLACIGGSSGHCNQNDGAWSGNKVTCAAAPGQQLSVSRKDTGDATAGWGMDLKFQCCEEPEQCILPDAAVTCTASDCNLEGYGDSSHALAHQLTQTDTNSGGLSQHDLDLMTSLQTQLQKSLNVATNPGVIDITWSGYTATNPGYKFYALGGTHGGSECKAEVTLNFQICPEHISTSTDACDCAKCIHGHSLLKSGVAMHADSDPAACAVWFVKADTVIRAKISAIRTSYLLHRAVTCAELQS